MITVTWDKKFSSSRTNSAVDRFMNANGFYETYDFGGLGDFSPSVCANFEGSSEDAEFEILDRIDDLKSIVGHNIDIVLYEG